MAGRFNDCGPVAKLWLVWMESPKIFKHKTREERRLK
jgi:hypothetical protein